VTDVLWIGGAASALVGLSVLVFFDPVENDRRPATKTAVHWSATHARSSVPAWR
jgi:hypothetical protein